MIRQLALLLLLHLLQPFILHAQQYVLVLNKSDHTAWQLNALTGEKVAEYPTGIGPHEVAVSPNARWAVITNYGDNRPGNTLTLIDLHNRKVAKTIDLDTLRRPHGVAWFSDGQRIAVSVEAQQAVAIVDVASSQVLSAIKTGQRVSHMVELGADERYIYVPNLGSGTVSALSIEEGRAIQTIPTGDEPEGIALANDGTEIWATNRASNSISIIDTQSLEITQTLSSSSFPIRAETSPDGRYVAVSNAQSSEISVFDVRSKEEIARISTLTPGVENGMPIGLTFSADGDRLYVANSNARQVAVIDADAWKLIETFRTGNTPDGIAFFTLND